MMKMNKRMSALFAIVLAISMVTACSGSETRNATSTKTATETNTTKNSDSDAADTESDDSDSSESSTDSSSSDTVEEVTKVSYNNSDTKTDWQSEIYTTITFTDSGVSADSTDGVEISGTTVTITKAGTYVLSGECDDGNIIVNADKDEKVWLVLNGLTLTSKTTAPVYVKQADKVTMTLADGTENTISDTERDDSDDEDNAKLTAAIYSKDDLSINGSGTLTVNGNNNDGITSKDKLKVCGGNIIINAEDDGIYGKDICAIKDGTLTINVKDDGVKAKENLIVDGGTITVTCTENGHGFHSDYYMTVNDGTIKVTQSYEGFEANFLTVNGGDVDLTSSDDGINTTASANSSSSNSNTTGNNDYFTNNDSNSDNGRPSGNPPDRDGNASGGAIGMGPGGKGGFGGGHGGGMAGDNDGSIMTINGGNIVINAEGDGLDSNGYIYINGGTITVNGPEQGGNGALDYGTAMEVNGGNLIAAGVADMIENPTGGSQSYISYNFSGNVSSGSEITVKDSAGNTVLTYTSVKRIGNLTASKENIKSGSTYTVYVNGTEDGTVTAK